ncbi:MAG: T9SS type A sorting domain-containing protein [Cyclobacteriaceae bacterium]
MSSLSPRALLFIFFACISSGTYSQVWIEDFTGEVDGAVNGTAAGTVGGTWSVTTTPTGGAPSFSRLNVGAPYGGIFRIDNTTTEGVWQSNNMNISALGEVALQVLMGGNNATVADYVRAFYRIDGGPEIMFAEVFGTVGTTVFTASSAVVSGTNLQIVMRGRDNSGGGGLMGFDDVTVTDISVLYSIASADWNNGNTWSTVGFAGPACACTPNATSRAIIGNNRTVNFTADGNAAGLEIQNTGTLRWMANGLDLTMERGGPLNVQNGGTLTRLATTTSSIIFTSYTFAITNAGTISMGLFDFNSSSNSTILNSGTLTLSTSPIGLDINGTNGYVITNSATGTFNLTGMSLGNGNLVINNSGIINQSGDFLTGTIDAGSDFNNLATGTWNWSLTPNTAYDVDMNTVMDLSVAGNTFNYNAAGAQRILPITHHNITLSNSGAKDANNSALIAVRGNWLVSGTATFTEGTGTVTLSGTGAQTITNPAGETFNNLVINNSFATSPQITLDDNVTVSTVLTMTDGNVNLNTNTFTITAATAGALVHSQLPAAGWMYGGSLTRSFPATAIAVNNIAGFFPMGGSANFRPFQISKSNTVSSNGTITVAYTDASTATNIAFVDGASTIQRRHDAFWTLTKTGVTAGTFAIGAGGTGFTIGLISETRLTKLSDAINIGVAGASTGSAADVRAHRTGLLSAQLLNNFYMASTNSVNTPLPVELLYFRSEVHGDEVISTWKTAMEKNNHFFSLEKTVDFETFYEVGVVDGQGTSQEEHSYSISDDSPFLGKSYYRLKQTDFDGKFTFSDPVMINYDGPSYPILNVYPNPFNGKEITIEIKGLKDVPVVPLQLYNIQGQKVMDLISHENGPGVFKAEILFPENLPQGVYIIKAGKTLQLTRKIFVRE